MITMCTICSDLIDCIHEIYATPCGHLFHQQCLTEWINRSKTCPQCRNRTTEKTVIRLFPTAMENANSPAEEVARLQLKMDNTLLQLQQQETKLKEWIETNERNQIALQANQQTIRHLEKKTISKDAAIEALKNNLKIMQVDLEILQNKEREHKNLIKKMELLQGMQKVFDSTVEEVEKMLQSYTDVRSIATFATALKKALSESEAKKSQLRSKLIATELEVQNAASRAETYKTQCQLLDERFTKLAKEYEDLKNHSKYSNAPKKQCIRSGVEHSLGSPSDARELPALINLTSDEFASDLSFERPAQVTSSNTSVNNLIQTIENADSPYLNMKQSSLTWDAIAPRRVNKSLKCIQTHTHKVFDRYEDARVNELSVQIFKGESSDDENVAPLSRPSSSYNGLGGHSPWSATSSQLFNASQMRPPPPKKFVRRNINKSKGPGTQDVGKMLKNAFDNFKKPETK